LNEPEGQKPRPAAGARAAAASRRSRLFRAHSAALGQQARKVPLRALIPNLVTLLALCAGLTAIRMTIDGRFDIAVAAIFLAAVLDGLDGRLARMLKSTSRFGAELDSLADFVNFGVAPAVLLYVWAFQPVPGLGWMVALIFALCAALRLARFNVDRDRPVPQWQRAYFIGVPAPAGAIVVLLPFYVQGLGVPHGTWITATALVHTLVMGALMVSWQPTYSGKALGERVDRRYVLPLFVAMAGLAAVLATYPYLTLTLGSLAYLASVPLAGRTMARRERAEASHAVTRSSPPTSQ
jgi:CDP-diacylglycerol--serine O-phosphatidyltransferase